MKEHKRHIIIGDVHGCLEELKQLLEKIRLQPGDHVYFIGDLIDRGPDSAGVVQYVRALSDIFPLVLITGNHEEKFLRYLHNKENNPSAMKMMKGIDIFESYLQVMDTEDISFLHNSYINYRIPGKDICLLHAGITGNTTSDLFQNHPYSYELLKSSPGMNLILKTRFLDDKGHFVGLGQESGSSVFWADRYDGRFGKVFFGHHAIINPRPAVFNNAVNLDTGCVYGGWLSACLMDDADTAFVNVQAGKIHSQKL